MKNQDAFSSCHPVVNFLYFALVLGCFMVLMHPASLLISSTAALIYAVQLYSFKAARSSLCPICCLWR